MGFNSNHLRVFSIALGGIVIAGVGLWFFNAPRDEVSETVNSTDEDTEEYTELIEVVEVERGSYGGVIPCADCEGINTEVVFTAENNEARIGRYVLTETYLGVEEGTFVTTGEWVLDTYEASGYENDFYILYDEAGNETGLKYLVVDDDTLVMLDMDGKIIESDIPYELIRK